MNKTMNEYPAFPTQKLNNKNRVDAMIFMAKKSLNDDLRKFWKN